MSHYVGLLLGLGRQASILNMRFIFSRLIYPSLFLLGIAINVNGAEDINVLGRIHFNTQTADFEKTREFYRLLGYTQGCLLYTSDAADE